MSHALDKETVSRILHLHQVQGLSPQIIAQRFGFSTSRIHNLIRRKLQANSNITLSGGYHVGHKLQASSAIKGTHSNGRILKIERK